jgi:hypothetical protein
MAGRQAPSWIGTLVVAIAVAALCLRAAAELRRAVAPTPAPEGGAPSTILEKRPETH